MDAKLSSKTHLLNKFNYIKQRNFILISNPNFKVIVNLVQIKDDLNVVVAFKSFYILQCLNSYIKKE